MKITTATTLTALMAVIILSLLWLKMTLCADVVLL